MRPGHQPGSNRVSILTDAADLAPATGSRADAARTVQLEAEAAGQTRHRNIVDMEDAIVTGLRISNDISEMDIALVHRFLATESYWASGLPFETLAKSLSNSLCFAGFVGDRQVAFGRVVTDLATFGYLKDVFVVPAYRGRGYGQALVEAMLVRLDHEEVDSLMLATQDAHSLYGKLGFEAVEGSGKLMRRIRR